jgi:hypothetical protein
MGSGQSTTPRTSFRGTLKQLQCEHFDEKQSYAFDAVFPAFRRLDEYLTFRNNWGPVNTGVGSRVLYVGRGRERRYAGDKTLSRGRYFALCNNEYGNDCGTLLNELKAYYSYESRLPCEIFDSTISDAAATELSKFRHKPIEWPHILLRIGPKAPNHVANHITGAQHPIIHLPLALDVVSVEIENVVDLRLPDAQRWFHRHFLAMEAALRVSEPGLPGSHRATCRFRSKASTAQFSAPRSWPANSAFLRLRAIGLIERSTVLESISIRPSLRKRVSPSGTLSRHQRKSSFCWLSG